MKEVRSTVCRVCHANCSLLVEVEDGIVGKVHGDKTNPAYQGYSCIKGRELPSYHAAPERLLHSQARQADGSFAPVRTEAALDAIAGRLQAIVDRHGASAVACYHGTHSYQNLTAARFLRAFMAALGSPMFFDTTTIDQPGKTIARVVHGTWSAGGFTCEEADAWLLVGTNPIASMQGGFSVNPAANLHQAQARGLKLVVIDPRRTDVARKAAIHLQPRPGMSAPILAAMLRHIILSGNHDLDFIGSNTAGFDRLAEAVSPFTLDHVAEIADVPAGDLVAATEILGTATKLGVNVGTGPNMSGHPSVVEYLALAMMTIGGHWRRAGEMRPNPGVLIHPMPAIAQAISGGKALRPNGQQMRVRGLAETAGGLPTAALSDEILLEGERKIRALIVVGGNPLMAIPDQRKTQAALADLDLLVSIDPRMSATARLSHFVMAPKLSLETIMTSAGYELLGAFGPGWGFMQPYAQYAPPVVDPPAGSELIEEWEFFFGLAQRMGLQLCIPDAAHIPPLNQAHAFDLDMTCKPSSEELYEKLFAGSPVPLAHISARPRGSVFDRPAEIVQPANADAGRLQLGDEALMAELRSIANGIPRDPLPYRLVSRRLSSIHNSSWHAAPNLAKREPYNAAYMNPVDLEALGLPSGGVVELRSRYASVAAIAQPSTDVRSGVVSMSHCWGDTPGSDSDPNVFGTSVARLIANDVDFDPLTGLPRMSDIPIDVHPIQVPSDEGQGIAIREETT